MKRLVMAVLCCALLCVPVRAEEEKLVALTFDDGPSGRFTRRLLEGLEERNAKATFLLCGYRIEVYPELTERIWREGHEIGLHGYSHCSMAQMCTADLKEELEKTMALIPEGCGVRFVRPPGGISGANTCTVAAEQGLAVLYWSIDPRDWATDDTDTIIKRVLDNARDGDIILLHDMSDSSVDAALAIVDALQKRGFRFVTVSQLAERKGIPLNPGEEYYSFK